MKRDVILVLLLVLAVAAIFFPIYKDSHGYFGSSDVKWSIDDSGHLTVSGSGTVGVDNDNEEQKPKYNAFVMVLGNINRATDMELEKIDAIQSLTIEGNITEIGTLAFSALPNLQTVELPDTLEVIHKAAFRDSGLTSVEIPASVKIVDRWVFAGCNELADIQLHDGLQEIGIEAFGGCNIKELRIPETVEHLGRSVFGDCPDNFDLYMYPMTAPKTDGPLFNADKNITIHVRKNAQGYNQEPWTAYNVKYDLEE